MMNATELVTVKRVCRRLKACFHSAESDNGRLLEQLCSPSSKLNNNNLRVAQFFTRVLLFSKLSFACAVHVGRTRPLDSLLKGVGSRRG